MRLVKQGSLISYKYYMKSLENKVIYQIYPKSFYDTTGNGYGDIQGIIEKLDYIKDLGADYIWLSPCCCSPQNDNGYDISDYYTIEPLFGTNEDYTKLITEAKSRDMKIMMDLVLNHTSNEHPWFQSAMQGDQYYQDFYIWRDQPNEIESIFGGTAWTYEPKVEKYYFHLFDKTQPDLNWANPELRKHIYKIVNYWIEQGVEGFRLDMIDLIGKDVDALITSKGPNYIPYLQELNEQTFKDQLLTVGECWCSTIEQTKQMCNPKGLTQAFHFNHLELCHEGNKWHRHKVPVQELCHCFDTWQNEFDGIEANVMCNHDQPRMISSWLNDAKYRKESAKLLITVYGMLKGNMYLYQGEEIGMTSAHFTHIEQYNDVETMNAYHKMLEEGYSSKEVMDKIAVTSRDNARVPMQWDATNNAGFTNGKPWLEVVNNYQEVNVQKDLDSEDSIYHYYKSILTFRKEHYDFINQPGIFEAQDDIYIMKKPNLLVVANFGQDEVLNKWTGEVLFHNYDSIGTYLRPYEVIVYKR